MSITAAARKAAKSIAPKQKGQAVNNVTYLRPRQLDRLFWKRHGRTIPPDDTGLRDMRIMLDHIIQGSSDAHHKASIFLCGRCPWLSAIDRASEIASAFDRRKFWDKSALGDVLGLTWEERSDCKITTIRPAGASQADMDQRRAMKAAEAARESRRKKALHPEPKLPLPLIRAKAIAGILRPGERCTATAICKQLKRTKNYPFALKDKALATAVHNAIAAGVAAGLLWKTVEPGRRMPVAWVGKIGAPK